MKHFNVFISLKYLCSSSYTEKGIRCIALICCYSLPTDELTGIERQDAGVRPLLDAVEMFQPEEGQIRHEPRVTIPTRGTEIYKATLVSLLNQDPQLSHERSVTCIYSYILKR